MNRRFLFGIALLGVVAVVAFAAWQRVTTAPGEGRLELAGDVRSQVRTVRAPAVSYPAADYAVGIPGAKASPQRAAAVALPCASRTPVVSGRLAAVHVGVGSRVETGQVVARLDTAMLDLGVEQARTAAAKAHADADVLAATLDTIADNRHELADARSELEDARTELLDGRARLAEQLAALEKLAKAPMPPGAMPPTASPPGAPTVDPRTLIPKLKAKLAQLDAGLAKMDTAEAKLDTGASELRDARSRVTDARDLMELLAEGRDIAVRVAETRRAQATLRSPVSGVVIDARLPGTVAMVNAPIVRVRPDGPTLVDTYVTGIQLAGVSVGTAAEVDYDSNAAGPLPGRVSRIGGAAEFPPASFPTAIVHMTRAVRVTIALDGGGWAPPGTPADVTILTDPDR